MTAMSIGRFSSFAPDAGKARESAARMFQLIDSEPTIDPTSEEGSKLVRIYMFVAVGLVRPKANRHTVNKNGNNEFRETMSYNTNPMTITCRPKFLFYNLQNLFQIYTQQ